MVWFRTDDTFYSHARVVSIPRAVRPSAIGTWLLCGTWSAAHRTDGAIPGHMLEEVGASSDGADALVTAGLWRRTRTGYQFRNWSEYQPTRAELDEQREAERQRKAAYRARLKGNGTPPDDGGRPANVPTGHPGDKDGVPPYPARPVPTRPDPALSEGLATADAAVQQPGTDLVLVPEPAVPRPYPEAFERFWQAYPRHEGKGAALKAWQAARRLADGHAIVEGAERYAKDPNREPQYTAHASTWLRRRGWEDEPLPPRRPVTKAEQQRDAVRGMFDDLAAAGHTKGA